jgi:hypothetical protein
MLATLAIINMAVAAVLINDTMEAPSAQQAPTEIVASADAENNAVDWTWMSE